MTTKEENRESYFGFRQVSEEEKSTLVKDVFHSVANRYDLMNDLMSFGLHRVWKDIAVTHSGVRRGHTVLDLAAGSGDLTQRLIQRVGDKGRVVSVDISRPMLQNCKRRMIDRGIINNVAYVLSDAEKLPFENRQFDCITIGFGLRNITRVQSALISMFRVLRPGGRILVLEFSRPSSKILTRLYDQYSFAIIPRIGRAVTGDEDSYRYLIESIRRHPDQERLQSMMTETGFEDVRYLNLMGGVVALHIGFRY